MIRRCLCTCVCLLKQEQDGIEGNAILISSITSRKSRNDTLDVMLLYVLTISAKR